MVAIKLWRILLALLAITLILLIWRFGAASALNEASLERDNVAAFAERITRLRSEWEGNQAARSRAQALFGEDIFKQRGIAQQSAQGIKAEYKDLDAQALSRLTRALFESPIQIKTFTVERKSDQGADVYLEIAW
ncbi:MAG: hypothetical protein LBF86_01305 [Helicobacteraceae bacterium]|jgi:hypothetical protein|nr:hypothetical protein [Helicobacteraceae bacterium]